MAAARLFIALWPDERVRGALSAWRDGWRFPRSATPVDSARLHLTLHFLGDVDAARSAELAERLRVPFSPFELAFGRRALWPHGIAVLEPHTIPEALLQLHQSLGRALQGLSLPQDARPYRPHVTLARRAATATAPADGPPLLWPVERYALMESTRGGYTTVQLYGQ